MSFPARHTITFAALLLLTVPLVQHAGAQAAVGQTQRPTSTPYSGDLSIFEEPNRDQKLQIDRVMDILHM